MTEQEMIAMLQQQQQMIANLQAQLDAKNKVSMKVSGKTGCVVVSGPGLGRYPTSLFYEQWHVLLNAADEIRAFCDEKFNTAGEYGNVRALKTQGVDWHPHPQAAAEPDPASIPQPPAPSQPSSPPRPAVQATNGGIPTGGGTLRPNGNARPMNGGR
jgi:hypothetical protein